MHVHMVTKKCLIISINQSSPLSIKTINNKIKYQISLTKENSSA
jgi:hypothetical protein